MQNVFVKLSGNIFFLKDPSELLIYTFKWIFACIFYILFFPGKHSLVVSSIWENLNKDNCYFKFEESPCPFVWTLYWRLKNVKVGRTKISQNQTFTKQVWSYRIALYGGEKHAILTREYDVSMCLFCLSASTIPISQS